MSVNKKSYFQGGGGVNEPTPGKVKYKADPAIVVQPRFKEPFYRNYDLYDVPGEHGPGSGWSHLNEHSSVTEFLKFRRNRLRGKYEADDSWTLDDGQKTKKNPNIKVRGALLSQFVKIAKDINHIDFPIDDQINQEGEMIYPSEESYHNPTKIGPEGGSEDLSSFPSSIGPTDFSSYVNSTELSGSHSSLPAPDAEGKSGDALNFGRDYTEDDEFPNNMSDEDLQNLMNKYLSPAEGDLFGLPDGIDPNSDLDAVETVNTENPAWGTSDAGEQMYEDKWNI